MYHRRKTDHELPLVGIEEMRERKEMHHWLYYAWREVSELAEGMPEYHHQQASSG